MLFLCAQWMYAQLSLMQHWLSSGYLDEKGIHLDGALCL